MAGTEGIVTITGSGVAMDGHGLKESLSRFRRHHQETGDALLNISGIGTPTGEPVDKDDPRPEYKHQAWPKMLYHADGREDFAKDEAGMKALLKTGFRNEPYPKVQIALADAKTEKAEQVAKNTTLESQIRSLSDQLEKMKSQNQGLGQ